MDRVDRGEGRMQAGATQGHRCTFGGRVMAREGKCGQGAGTAGGKQLGMTGAQVLPGWALADSLGLVVGSVGKPQMDRVGKGRDVPSPGSSDECGQQTAQGQPCFPGSRSDSEGDQQAQSRGSERSCWNPACPQTAERPKKLCVP